MPTKAADSKQLMYNSSVHLPMNLVRWHVYHTTIVKSIKFIIKMKCIGTMCIIKGETLLAPLPVKNREVFCITSDGMKMDTV